MSSRGGDLAVCLHDCLSLGEVELGLTQLPQPSDNAVEYSGAEKSNLSTTIYDTKDDEINRLPILLRILQSSRPLSSIPIFADMTPTSKVSLPAENHDDTTDSTISEAVNRLEDRAAMYSAAEGVQVVACHLAPAVTRSFGRLPPLSKIHSLNPNNFSNASGSLDISYNTLPLKQTLEKSVSAFGVASNANPLISSLGKKRKRISDVVADDNDAPRSKARTGTLLHAEEMSTASEDTQEFVVTKTLHDLIRLTVTSLNQAPFNSVASSNMADDDGDGGGGMLGENMSLSITEHDSILSEVAKSTHQEKQMGACDLASTVASLMHYVPCLRHRHVSAALCRGAFSQAPELISRMGANCPCSAPLLVAGCLDVYRYATANNLLQEQERSTYSAIAENCKKSLRKLSKLSKRDCSRIYFKLSQEKSIMIDLQLDLATEISPMTTACFLLNHLSSDSKFDTNDTKHAVDGTERFFSNDFGSSSPRKYVTRSLQDHLAEDSRLLFCAIELLNREMQQLCVDHVARTVAVGQSSPILRSLTFLMCRLSLDHFLNNSTKLQVSELVSTTIKNVLSLLEFYQQKGTAPCASTSESVQDIVFGNALAILLLATLALFPTSDVDEKNIIGGINLNVLRMQAFSSISECIRYCPQSPGSRVLVKLTLFAMKYSNIEALKIIMEKTSILGAFDSSIDSILVFDVNYFSRCLQQACAWIDATIPSMDQLQDDTSLLLDPQLIICRLLCEKVPNIEKSSFSLAAVKAIFDLGTKNELLLAFRDARMVRAFAMASAHIHGNASLVVTPLVFPVQMEQLGAVASFGEMEGVNHYTLVFLVKLMYCFFFLERFPNSPFAIDPRMIPLKEVYMTCERLQGIDASLAVLCDTLKGLIDRLCPEIRMRARSCSMRRRYYSRTRRQNCEANRASKSELTAMLRRSVESFATDPTGLIAAKTLLVSNGFLVESDLTTITASALLSSPSSPALFYTYPMLYRDPLSILKCPLSLWKRPGIRRLALTILTSLLETNDFVVSAGLNSENQEEFLQARNVIVLRGLIRSFSDKCITYPCLMVTSVIRKILASNRGVTATLVKQVLSSDEIDWLIEIAPEMVNDTSSFMSLFSESDRSSVGAGDKLLISDGILRLVAIRGYQSESEVLVQAIMAHLINSFFFIVGMAGVHPNTLSGDGRDSVSATAKAAFRIFKTLHKIRLSRTRLRSESAMFLQKFVGLCKGEILVGSLPAAITNRQKGLIKELLDAALKAADSMGLVLQNRRRYVSTPAMPYENEYPVVNIELAEGFHTTTKYHPNSQRFKVPKTIDSSNNIKYAW